MKELDITYILLLGSLFIATTGYAISVMLERKSIIDMTFTIKSKAVPTQYIDSLDMLVFKLGRKRMNIGDEVRVVTESQIVRGMLLGAKSRSNLICILEKTEEIKELSLKSVRSVRILKKYGRFF
jgi:hypothetical protein